MKQNALSMHSTAAGRANLHTYIKAAQRAGFDAIEPTKDQLMYFLNAGNTAADVKALLGKTEITAVGWLADIERQGAERTAMLHEAEKLFALTQSVGGHAVELINGPVDWHAVDCYRRGVPYAGYMGLQGLAQAEQQRLTVANLQALADLAQEFGLTLFFEPLCWTPIPSLREGLPLVERAERDNLKVVVDFYHNYIAGLDAAFLSQLPAAHILGVHVCDAREPDERVPCEEIFRDVGLYEGVVPIRAWVDAVKSTGFQGWWTYETFSKREAEQEIYEFAAYIHRELQDLVCGEKPCEAQA